MVRWRWGVAAAWLLVGAAATGYAPRVLSVLSLGADGDTETEAARANRLLRERFARPLNELFAVTIDAPAPLDSPPAGRVLDSLIAALERQSYSRAVVSWRSSRDSMFMSRDRRTTFLVLALSAVAPDSLDALVDSVRAVVRRTLDAVADGAGYRAQVTGLTPLDVDVRRLSAADARRAELRLLPLTALALMLAFGAAAAALLPLLVGFLTIWISLAIITIIGAHLPMSVVVLNVTTMLGLGTGIDYSLLVITRFRDEMGSGRDARDAAARALATAGAAVVTAGMTVAVGCAALLVTPLAETRSVGVAGLVVVGTAVMLATTLLPGLLAMLGRQIERPAWLARRLAWYRAPLQWKAWARIVGRRPGAAVALGGLAIALLAIPALGIRIGVPARNWWPAQTEAGRGIRTLEAMGVANAIQPIRVLVEAPVGERVVSAAHLRGLRALSDSLRADPRVAQVRSLMDLKPGTSMLGYSLFYSDLAAARARHADFLDAYLSADGRVALLDVIPADTASLASAMEVVRHARRLASARADGPEEPRITVGGYTAKVLDLQELTLGRFPALVALVLSVTGVMLAVAFRSLLIPAKAVVLNLLSVAASFGLIVVVFQHGIGGSFLGLSGPTSAIFYVVPPLVFAVVFGLSMDYEVFLLARVKEGFEQTGDNDRATQDGLAATASTITSAALIMVLVFGAFAFARVLVIQLLGFGLAVAVLVDATIIRMLLAPAILHLAGQWNWWPGVPILRRQKTSE